MTKEEREKAIAYGKRVIKLGLNDETQAFCEMAIKALEQEPCEDYISREAVLMEIDKYMCGVPFDEKGIDVVLKELPHVTPTRKKGKWIGDKDYPICEKCGCNIYEEYIGRNDYAWIEKPMRFCPNCGTEMESEDGNKRI